MKKIRTDVVALVQMGMLAAIAVVLVMLIHFPIIPAVSFIEYDMADVPVLIGTPAVWADPRPAHPAGGFPGAGLYPGHQRLGGLRDALCGIGRYGAAGGHPL